MAPTTASERWRDVRLVGFAWRTELEAARALLEAMLPQAASEPLPLADAIGRVLAAPAPAPAHLPPAPRARVDGYALDAAATFGAGPYNPLELPVDGTGPVSRIVAGAPMPPGTDAVLPFAAATADAVALAIAEPVASGVGVEPAGSAWRRGDVVAPAGCRLTALDLARAAEAGLEQLDVVRRPEVRVLVPGAKAPGPPVDPLLLLLRGLVARDGGLARATSVTGLGPALRDARPADLVLVAGRSGSGADDAAAPALASLGRVEVHGLAIAPGGTAGLGRVGDLPVLLLPGAPLACLAAYELLAGPAVRRLAGLPPALPHPRRRMRLGAKIASEVGTTELRLVRRGGEGVAPLSDPDRAVLATTAGAIGFVLVPAASEGHQAGSEVEVHLFDHVHG